MKSESRMSDHVSIEEFWRWFADKANSIASNPENGDLINDLDQQVSLTWPQLAWEIGPDASSDWYFALSPNLNRDLFNQAKEAIQAAPKVLGWKFYARRQRKAWDGRFELETDEGIKQFNSSDWRFVFLRYPDGEKELVLVTPDAGLLSPDDRWQAAAVVIEGLLGEECLLVNVDSFALEAAVDAKLSSQTKPIHLLPKTFDLS